MKRIEPVRLETSGRLRGGRALEVGEQGRILQHFEKRLAVTRVYPEPVVRGVVGRREQASPACEQRDA